MSNTTFTICPRDLRHLRAVDRGHPGPAQAAPS
jgi:hypothetical protein